MKAVTLRQNGVEHTLMAVEKDDLKEGLEIWVARGNGLLHGHVIDYKCKTRINPDVLEVHGHMVSPCSSQAEEWTVFPGDEGVPGCAYDDRFPRIFLTEEEATLVVDEVQRWVRDWQYRDVEYYPCV